MLTLVSGYVLGLLLGLRHAFEPDHLLAVSTLVSDRHRRSHPWVLGATWGVGHTLSLFLEIGRASCRERVLVAV